MTRRKILIEHNDRNYVGEVMRIEKTSLGNEDHGILTFGLQCSGDGTGIVAGNMCLDTNTKHADANTPDLGRGEYGRYGTAYGLDVLMEVMSTVGVYKWEELKGKSIIILFEQKGEDTSSWGNMSVGIANLIDEDKVLIFKEHADKWLDAQNSKDLESV